MRAIPLAIAVSADTAFNRAVLDHELQMLEVRSILQLDRGRMSVVPESEHRARHARRR